MTNFAEVGRVARECRVSLRLVRQGCDPDEWSTWLTSPAPHYLEGATGGPYNLKDITAIEINPTESRRRGARLPPAVFDRSEELAAKLSAAGFSFKRSVGGHFLVEVTRADQP